ncbi:MAG TPA: MBL fold metallo-hydrolase [Paludibaculum sp.]
MAIDTAHAPRPIARRRWLAGLGVGVAGVGAGLAYKAAPTFWRQFASELGHPIVPAPHRPDIAAWPNTGIHAAWLGHATVYLKIDGFTILTDPVFSRWIGLNLGPLTLGMKRLVEPALELESVPKPDLILLSHAHMDHFDIPTLRAMENPQQQVVTARATSDLLRLPRYQRVQEVGWGEVVRVGPASIRAIQVNHWGARMRTDTWRGYNGYVIQIGKRRVLFAGDTAQTDLFRHVGGAELALMPIGAYNPWIRFHCNPEQAWHMANDARADVVLPVHFQTFHLSQEPSAEPIHRILNAAGASASTRVPLRAIGQSLHLA